MTSLDIDPPRGASAIWMTGGGPRELAFWGGVRVVLTSSLIATMFWTSWEGQLRRSWKIFLALGASKIFKAPTRP